MSHQNSFKIFLVLERTLGRRRALFSMHEISHIKLRTLIIKALWRTPVVEETVLHEFAINTQTSLQASERVLGVGHSTIMHILYEDIQCPYHFQKVQALCDDDYHERIAFSSWYLQHRVAQPDFLSWILFSGESCFTQDDDLNLHNMHLWA